MRSHHLRRLDVLLGLGVISIVEEPFYFKLLTLASRQVRTKVKGGKKIFKNGWARDSAQQNRTLRELRAAEEAVAMTEETAQAA